MLLVPLVDIGPWDYGVTVEKIGISKHECRLRKSFQIGITGLHLISDWDYRITCLLKLGLRDYTSFEIGIIGLQDPPYRALHITLNGYNMCKTFVV